LEYDVMKVKPVFNQKIRGIRPEELLIKEAIPTCKCSIITDASMNLILYTCRKGKNSFHQA